jgi:hypothetical protein
MLNDTLYYLHPSNHGLDAGLRVMREITWTDACKMSRLHGWRLDYTGDMIPYIMDQNRQLIAVLYCHDTCADTIAYLDAKNA